MMGTLTNVDILRRYETKIERQTIRKALADRKIVTAVNVMVRATNKLDYYKRQRRLLLEAIDNNQPFRQQKEKKPKGKRGRLIELD